MESPIWRGRDDELRPFGNIKASDSANLDMIAEVLNSFYNCRCKFSEGVPIIWRLWIQWSQKLAYVVQLLMRSGYGPEETMMMMVPEAYKKHPTLMVKYPEVSGLSFCLMNQPPRFGLMCP